MFTTCDAGAAGTDLFAPCPLTATLAGQLRSDVAGVISAPDPLGGGQDPEWTSETFSSDPSPTGGIVHVALGFGTGRASEKLDLIVVLQGSQLLVDDIYCTGTQPGSGDALAADWLARSTCS